MNVTLLDSERGWECPNCAYTRVTVGQVGAVIHNCAGLGGLIAPLVVVGTDCRVRIQRRDDYLGRERAQLDADGRPVTAVVTDHADGRRDCFVLAPTATSGGGVR